MSTNWSHVDAAHRTFGDRILIASDVFSFKTGPLSHSHIFTSRLRKPPFARKPVCAPMGETLQISGCRRHTGDVACYAAVTVSLTEQCIH